MVLPGLTQALAPVVRSSPRWLSAAAATFRSSRRLLATAATRGSSSFRDDDETDNVSPEDYEKYHSDLVTESRQLRSFGPTDLRHSKPQPLNDRPAVEYAVRDVLIRKPSAEAAGPEVIASALLQGEVQPSTWIKLMRSEGSSFRTPRDQNKTVMLVSNASENISNFFLYSVWPTMLARADFAEIFDRSKRLFDQGKPGSRQRTKLSRGECTALQHARKGNMDRAFAAWASSTGKNVEIFNTLLQYEVSVINKQLSEEELQKIQSRYAACPTPNINTTIIALFAFAKAHNAAAGLKFFAEQAKTHAFSADDCRLAINFFLETLVEVSHKPGSADDVATDVLKWLASASVTPDDTTFYNVMLINKHRGLDALLQLYREMTHVGIEPSMSVLALMVETAAFELKHPRDTQLFASRVIQVLQQNSPRLHADPRAAAQVLSGLVDLATTSDDHKMVLRLFEMSAEHASLSPHLPATFWNGVIKAFIRQHKTTEALSTFDMVPPSTVLPLDTYEVLLRSCRKHVGGGQVAVKLFQALKDCGYNGPELMNAYLLLFQAVRADLAGVELPSKAQHDMIDATQQVLAWAIVDKAPRILSLYDEYVHICLETHQHARAFAAALSISKELPQGQRLPLHSVLTVLLGEPNQAELALKTCEELRALQSGLPRGVSPVGLEQYFNATPQKDKFQALKKHWPALRIKAKPQKPAASEATTNQSDAPTTDSAASASQAAAASKSKAQATTEEVQAQPRQKQRGKPKAAPADEDGANQ